MSRTKRDQTISAISALRSQMVRETRAERVVHLGKIQTQRDQLQRSLAQRSKEIRSQERSALKQRDLLKRNQQRALIKAASATLATEFQKKLQSEQLIATMETEEAQLIERLRIAQELQRSAYEHLEFVMQDE